MSSHGICEFAKLLALDFTTYSTIFLLGKFDEIPIKLYTAKIARFEQNDDVTSSVLMTC